jgi:hypothetical protein
MPQIGLKDEFLLTKLQKVTTRSESAERAT